MSIALLNFIAQCEFDMDYLELSLVQQDHCTTEAEVVFERMMDMPLFN